jgi:hypothetical protein
VSTNACQHANRRQRLEVDNTLWDECLDCIQGWLLSSWTPERGAVLRTALTCGLPWEAAVTMAHSYTSDTAVVQG